MFLFFSRGKAKETCKPGQVDDTSEYFHIIARGMCKIFQVRDAVICFR